MPDKKNPSIRLHWKPSLGWPPRLTNQTVKRSKESKEGWRSRSTMMINSGGRGMDEAIMMANKDCLSFNVAAVSSLVVLKIKINAIRPK